MSTQRPAPVYWAGGNPFSHHQDRNWMVQAWQQLDTFIV
ncbi:MAG: molybdopterin-dependent oxidoreductase [Rhodopila sp.]|nr:molybdopterin-dependent oxidoreductase [Rhodopila sp.]